MSGLAKWLVDWIHIRNTSLVKPGLATTGSMRFYAMIIIAGLNTTPDWILEMEGKE